MRHDFYLAWRYLRHHKIRTLILVACLSLLCLLPLTLHVLLDRGERELNERAASTPWLVGAKGSPLDLTLNALYFSQNEQPRLTLGDADRIARTGWADPLPIHTRFRVQGHPLVGVTLDYFEFRGLPLASGNMLSVLGDCLLGADAALALGLNPGDKLTTAQENLFDLAGVYPLKLKVAGVLGKTHSPDDQAIFIDLKTAWVIEGLGHGHGEEIAAPSARPEDPAGKLARDAKLVTYTEINEKNLDSFHFHGDPSAFPISAIIVLPHDHRSSTLLRGRYLSKEDNAQIVQPLGVVQSLVEKIFRVKALFDAVVTVALIAALLSLGLVFALSLRLRQREMHTIFLMGCGKLTMARLLTAEILLLLASSAVLCVIVLQVIQLYAGDLMRRFIL